MKKIEIKNRFKAPENIRSMLHNNAERFSDKVAYRYFDSNNEVCELTYFQVYGNYNAIGTSLCAHNLQKKKIAIVSENRPEWMLSYCAIIGCGSVVMPLDKELMPAQIESFINYAEAEAVFCSGRYVDKILAMNLTNVSLIVDFDNKGSDDSRYCAYNGFIAEGERMLSDGYCKFKQCRYDSSKMSALIFTSGTTGTSKGVMLSEDNILCSMTASANMISLEEDNVVMSVLPMHHTYETCCGQLTALMIGMTICINNSLKYFMRNLKLFRPTTIVLVPLFVTTIRKKIQEEIKHRNKDKVVNAGVFTTKALRKVGLDVRKIVFSEITAPLGGRLKNIICGGAPIDGETVEWFENIGINVSQGYGITECAPLVAVNPLVTANYASVGLPIPGSRVKIITGASGSEYDAPVGEIGEICVKGGHVMLGYFKDEEATKNAFTEEGYFRTGDYGYMDSEGLLFITGRKKNIIVLNNGKNVYPEEIEEYLEKIDLIKECVVIGRNNDKDEVVLTALIYPDYDKFKGYSDSEIIGKMKNEVSNINKMLPIFKQVRSIEIRKNEFEKTTTNKIIRYKLS